jgi:hypothetical protein
MGVTPNTLYTPPKFRHLWVYFMIKNCQIIFPKVVRRTPPENAFMNAYFYFYCVVKCGNRALGINERIKKSSQTQKRTQTHHYRKVIEGPAGDSYQEERVRGTRTKRRESPRANEEVWVVRKNPIPRHSLYAYFWPVWHACVHCMIPLHVTASRVAAKHKCFQGQNCHFCCEPSACVIGCLSRGTRFPHQRGKHVGFCSSPVRKMNVSAQSTTIILVFYDLI